MSYVTVETGEELIRTGGVAGGMVPKLSAALKAVRGGVRRAHVINGLSATLSFSKSSPSRATGQW